MLNYTAIVLSGLVICTYPHVSEHVRFDIVLSEFVAQSRFNSGVELVIAHQSSDDVENDVFRCFCHCKSTMCSLKYCVGSSSSYLETKLYSYRYAVASKDSGPATGKVMHQ